MDGIWDIVRDKSVTELIFLVILRLDRSVQKILPTTLDCPVKLGNDKNGFKLSLATGALSNPKFP